MNVKRIVLFILTFVSLLPVFLSLIGSLNEEQVQANLQLYLTNLTLHASEANLDAIAQKSGNSFKYLVGDASLVNAEKEYQEAEKLAQNALEKLQQKKSLSVVEGNLANSDKIEKEISLTKQFIQKLDLDLGILEAQTEKNDKALTIWNNIVPQSTQAENLDFTSELTEVLKELWSQPTEILADAETQIKTHLKGWFRYKALEKLYLVQNRQEDLSLLRNQEQELALQVLIKLALINSLPLLGGTIGFGLLIFLFIQLLTKRKESFLVSINSLSWQTPWDGELIWQVLIVGFFFMGQIVLPAIFLVSGFDATQLSLRGKSVYILVSYILLATAGLSVLYFSIKSFFPLPQDWFRFRWLSNWILWGLGGYLVAIPLVFVVSLINQLFWQGQGGSNPLLFLALQAQDKVVLAIFFFTAAVAAPIFEEILFRGFLLPSLTRYVPVWGAILISSLVFAFAHLNLSEVFPLATLGIILGVVYTRSRNLLASILLHSLWNSGTLLSLFVLGSGAG
jgi:membrane protease YdiL (CAAX protease family)